MAGNISLGCMPRFNSVEISVLGVTAQVLFKHGYESGLQLVVGKLTSFGVLQSYLRPTPVVIPMCSALRVSWQLSRGCQRCSIG